MRRGLTLVETLIVIAITAILTGILAVVGFRAMHRAKVSACASNLMSIGKAMALYAADNNDEIPAYITHEITLPSGRLIKENTEALTGMYSTYGVTKAQWKCPLDRFPEPHGLPRWNAERPDISSYETHVNLWTIIDPDSGRFNLHSTPEPAKAAYLTDVKIVYAPDDFRTGHGKRSNGLAFDGHVKEWPLISGPHGS